jgi:hypothetical protein
MPSPQQPVGARPATKVLIETCPECGAEGVWSSRTDKFYCDYGHKSERTEPVAYVPAASAERLAEALRGMLTADACQMESDTEEPCQCNACIEARAALTEFEGGS